MLPFGLYGKSAAVFYQTFNVGPPSTEVAQHKSNIGSMSHVSGRICPLGTERPPSVDDFFHKTTFL